MDNDLFIKMEDDMFKFNFLEEEQNKPLDDNNEETVKEMLNNLRSMDSESLKRISTFFDKIGNKRMTAHTEDMNLFFNCDNILWNDKEIKAALEDDMQFLKDLYDDGEVQLEF